jgi:hypothetical protein
LKRGLAQGEPQAAADVPFDAPLPSPPSAQVKQEREVGERQ